MADLVCLVELESESGVIDEVDPQRCGEPVAFYARDDAARYGHVCQACWEGFDEQEREHYVAPEAQR